MRIEINKAGFRQARRWLAQLIAPAGTHVHDPDGPLCECHEGLLVDVLFSQIKYENRAFWIEATDDLYDMADRGMVEKIDNGRDYRLTRDGERQLARIWGPGRVPPWSGGHFFCDAHGEYDREPGKWSDCPRCMYEKRLAKIAIRELPWWHWKRLTEAFR